VSLLSGSNPTYGGALGRNPDSTTAGRGAVVITPKKKRDRFKGRKGRASKRTDSKVLPGAGGTVEFGTAALARMSEVEKRKAAEKLAASKKAKDVLAARRRPKDDPQKLADYYPFTDASSPRRPVISQEQSTAAAKLANVTAALAGVGVSPTPPKPKPQTRKGGSSSLKGKRAKGPGGGR
jgi:hypothetical protein